MSIRSVGLFGKVGYCERSECRAEFLILLFFLCFRSFLVPLLFLRSVREGAEWERDASGVAKGVEFCQICVCKFWWRKKSVHVSECINARVIAFQRASKSRAKSSVSVICMCC